jgi:hypothetical protein
MQNVSKGCVFHTSRTCWYIHNANARPKKQERRRNTFPGLACKKAHHLFFSAAFPMLSRACLGKMIIFSIKWHRKRFAELASGAMPLSHVYNQSTTAHTIDE